MQFAPPLTPQLSFFRRNPALRTGLALAILLAMATLAPCRAQVQTSDSVSEPAEAPRAAPARTPPALLEKAPLRAEPASRPLVATKPEWKELTLAQQSALQPLAAIWNPLSESHKRKWLAISSNFDKLPRAEQGKLQERMTEWVTLSPVQRNQARLNFAKTTELSPAEKQAKWEAYQALSAEEKKKLAERAPKAPAGAATTVKTVPKAKLLGASAPAGAASAPPSTATTPIERPKPVAKIPSLREAPAATFRHVDRNTLLPQQP